MTSSSSSSSGRRKTRFTIVSGPYKNNKIASPMFIELIHHRTDDGQNALNIFASILHYASENDIDVEILEVSGKSKCKLYWVLRAFGIKEIDSKLDAFIRDKFPPGLVVKTFVDTTCVSKSVNQRNSHVTSAFTVWMKRSDKFKTPRRATGEKDRSCAPEEKYDYYQHASSGYASSPTSASVHTERHVPHSPPRISTTSSVDPAGSAIDNIVKKVKNSGYIPSPSPSIEAVESETVRGERESNRYYKAEESINHETSNYNIRSSRSHPSTNARRIHKERTSLRDVTPISKRTVHKVSKRKHVSMKSPNVKINYEGVKSKERAKARNGQQKRGKSLFWKAVDTFLLIGDSTISDDESE